MNDTTSAAPSDAEIEKLAAEHLKAFSQFPMGGQVWFEGEVEFARAVLAKWGTQPQAGAVPQRWKAVPVNPTPEMWKAAKTVPDPNPPYPPHYGLVWDAMLAASPTPPAEQQAPTGSEIYVCARKCYNCGHAGINDDHADNAACKSCDWSTPQPVVREPLTDAQIAEMMRDTWGCASIAPRHALIFARTVERAHGITQKGGSNADT